MPLQLNVPRTYFDPGKSITGKASGTIPGRRFVKITTGGTEPNVPVVVLCSANDDPDFISAHDAAAGEPIRLIKGGVREVDSGGIIAAGANVQVGANGKAVAHSSTNPVVGRCAKDGVADGTIALYTKGSLA